MQTQIFIYDSLHEVEAAQYLAGNGRDVSVWCKGSFAEVKNYGDKNKVVREWLIVGKNKAIARPGDWIVQQDDDFFVVTEEDAPEILKESAESQVEEPFETFEEDFLEAEDTSL